MATTVLRNRDRVVALAGQECEVPPARELPWPERPKLTLRARFIRLQLWRLSLRLTPLPGEDLETFGRRVADMSGMGLRERPQDGDRAIWLTGSIWAWTSDQAFRWGAEALPRDLSAIAASSAQLIVERWR